LSDKNFKGGKTMTKFSTKRSLFASVIALMLCFSMLLGTTFAWFTDTVTSEGNKIQAGTLKVDLELLDKATGNWDSIKTSKAPIFNYNNWEPGYTDVKVLKIENEGSLALKWMAKFVSNEALTSLANVIDVYVYPSENEIAYPAGRDLTGYTKVGTVAEFVNSIEDTTKGELLAGKAAYLGIALKMQETAGNEYQNADIKPFDIQIVATQQNYEQDSFDATYDQFAEFEGGQPQTPSFTVFSAAELQAAFPEFVNELTENAKKPLEIFGNEGDFLIELADRLSIRKN
jgi:predicted ribosomally synthesized peptide with SipW-like signal peptide